MNQLSSFNFHEGWKNYKHRFFSKGFQIDKNILKIPEFSLNKKFDNVFVWPEQGLGDQILFSRFLNNLNLHGIKIYSLVHKKLDPVFKKSFPNINFVDHVNYNSFKSQVALGDLGNLFIKNIDDVIDSSSKYLKANYKNQSSLEVCYQKILYFVVFHGKQKVYSMHRWLNKIIRKIIFL